MSPSKMLAAALHYALDLERPVLPLAPRAKNPLTRRGLHDASVLEATVRAWWTTNPDANVGLLTGGGVLVVDVDGPVGARSLRELEREHCRLPGTIESATSRGRHLLLAVEGDARTTAGTLGPGLDTRGERAYIVAPPSIHQSGHVYRWRRAHDPDRHDLADAPRWLVELLAVVPGAPIRGVPTKGPRNTTDGGAAKPDADRSLSGRDWYHALEMAREGLSRHEAAEVLRKTSHEGSREAYVQRTIERAYAWHDVQTPRAVVTSTRLDHWPERPGKPAMTRLRLSLVTADGEVISAGVVVPSEGYKPTADLWRACFPDVDPRIVAAEWRSVARRLEGREFLVATRGGSVTWIRAAPKVPNNRRRSA